MADVSTGAASASGESSTSATPGSESKAKPTGATKVVSRGGDAVGFDDLLAMENAEVRAKREKASERKKAEPKEKREEKTAVDESKDKDRAPKTLEVDKAEKKKPEQKAKAEPKANDADEDDGGEDVVDEVERPKAKTHKYRVGDDEFEIPGDAVIHVPVNGQMEEFTYQDLVNELSGKTDYNRKYSEFGVEKGKFMKERSDLESFIGEFFTKSKEDGDSAWDFLAEMNGEDPIAFKQNLFRQQSKMLAQVFGIDLTDEMIEGALQPQTLSWREKRIAAKEAAEKKKADQALASQARQEIMETHGMDDATWDKSYKAAQHMKKGQFPKPQEVALVAKHIMVHELMEEVAPTLANNPDYGNIRASLAQRLLRNPSLGRDEVARLLMAEAGADLKAVANKVVKDAERDGTATPRRQAPRAVKQSPTSWDDL